MCVCVCFLNQEATFFWNAPHTNLYALLFTSTRFCTIHHRANVQIHTHTHTHNTIIIYRTVHANLRLCAGAVTPALCTALMGAMRVSTPPMLLELFPSAHRPHLFVCVCARSRQTHACGTNGQKSRVFVNNVCVSPSRYEMHMHIAMHPRARTHAECY